MVEVSIKTIGTENFVRGFNRFEAQMKDMREVFEILAVDFGDIVTKNFAMKGTPEKWRPLSPGYAKWKAKKRPGAPMLVFNGDLYESLRGVRDPGGRANTIRQIYPKRAEFGTIDPKAAHHHFGAPRAHLPRRKVVQLTEMDKKRWARIIHEWAVKGLAWIEGQRGKF